MRKLLFISALNRPYHLSRTLFIRFLAIIYTIAFASLSVQIIGLVGSHGILPVSSYLNAIKLSLGAKAYFYFPTIFWLNASDFFLQLICILGILFSILIVFGFLQSQLLFVVWFCYLSLVIACQTFTHFQWDILLLETGFIAIFYAPTNLYTSFKDLKPPSKWILFLLNWLLFRLMFASGAVKLLSLDHNWWNLTALTVHYETQPLPHWISYYVHHLPLWFHQFSQLIMFFIELICPFLIFLSRRFRIFAALIFTFFMILIMATGNYGFFNLVAIALCLTLLDDDVLMKCLPKKIHKKISPKNPSLLGHSNSIKKLAVTAFSLFMIAYSFVIFSDRLYDKFSYPKIIYKMAAELSGFHISSSYGLFSVMTTTRPEIIIEGSEDGEHWKTYEFKWKPGALEARPKFIIPHMPRLDWQMWFAALSNYQHNPWFINFLTRLLEGEPKVLALIKNNPFPKNPPKYIRSTLYKYNFTSPTEKKEKGNWWKRQYLRQYTPVINIANNEE